MVYAGELRRCAVGQFVHSLSFAALVSLFAYLLFVVGIGLIIVRAERRTVRDPKHGWGVYRLKIARFTCQRCRAQYADGDYIWQDPEQRLVCHVSCASPRIPPTAAALDVPFDAVRGPVAAV